jgi:hypothetical protein
MLGSFLIPFRAVYQETWLVVMPFTFRVGGVDHAFPGPSFALFMEMKPAMSDVFYG